MRHARGLAQAPSRIVAPWHILPCSRQVHARFAQHVCTAMRGRIGAQRNCSALGRRTSVRHRRRFSGSICGSATAQITLHEEGAVGVLRVASAVSRIVRIGRVTAHLDDRALGTKNVLFECRAAADLRSAAIPKFVRLGGTGRDDKNCVAAVRVDGVAEAVLVLNVTDRPVARRRHAASEGHHGGERCPPPCGEVCHRRERDARADSRMAAIRSLLTRAILIVLP